MYLINPVLSISRFIYLGVMHRILIVEDEARLAAFIEKGLRKNGFMTSVAEDGQAAIDLVNHQDFALMLLDIGLPIKDGWSVLQELRQQGKQLPIIVVTALNADTSSAIASGANDYVSKPFGFKDLLTKVQLQLSDDTA